MKSLLEQINDIALSFLEPLTTEETYFRVCEESTRLVGGDYCSVYLMENGQLKKVYASYKTLYKVHVKKNGYAYTVFKTHEVCVTHVEEFGEKYPLLKKIGIKTSTLIPLSYKKKSIGVLILQSKKKKKYTRSELHALKLLGSMASLAIQKTRLGEEAEMATISRDYFKTMESRLETIYKAGLKLLFPTSLKETYSTIVREAMKLVDADYGSIFLKSGSEVERVYASSQKLYKFTPRKQGKLYKVFKNKRPFTSTAGELEKTHPEMQALGIKSNLLVSLSYQNKTMGALTLLSTKKTKFTHKDISIIRLFIPLASLAIRKTQLYDVVKRTVEVRDLFIAIAAHELRTPLTTLNGYLQLLRFRTPKTKKPESDWINQLLMESGRLTHLVQELLDINKAQTGKLQYNFIECNLRDILHKVLSNFSIANSHRKLVYTDKLKKDKDIIIADHNKLIQVFSNILNNAAKFSEDVKPIELILTKEGRDFVVKVIDQGIGIPDKGRNKIFQLFYKGEHNTKEGIGLGLYLAKSMIDKHKGSITIESAEKVGTTVIVKLPAFRS